MDIRKYLVHKFEIFDELKLLVKERSFVYGYHTEERYKDFGSTIYLEFKQKFEYIGFAYLHEFGFDPDSLGKLNNKINDADINVSIKKIENFKADIELFLNLNGSGFDFDIMNEHDLVVKISILGKKKNSDLPLWKELLYSFLYLYENENYRAAFVQLYSAFESYLEFMGADPEKKVKEKLIFLIGNLKSKGSKYNKSFYYLREIRNTLAHGSSYDLSKDDIHNLFNFFKKTYDMK